MGERWAARADPHLFQQRPGLLWNRLGNVESRVATDSCWMAAQQRLFRGCEGRGGRWKDERDNHQNKKITEYSETHWAPVLLRAAELEKSESESTWNNTDHSHQAADVTAVRQEITGRRKRFFFCFVFARLFFVCTEDAEANQLQIQTVFFQA